MQDSNSQLIKFLSSVKEDKLLPLCEILKIDEEDINFALVNEISVQGLIGEDEIEEKITNQKEIKKLKKLRKGEIYRFAISKTILAGLQWRASKIAKKHPYYKQILIMTADKMGISAVGSVKELEARISQKAFNQFIEKLPEKEKEKLERELIKTINDLEIEGLGHIYLTATTALSAISSAVGITLPFVIYTSLTRAISILIGPIGWILGGVFTIWSLWQPNYKVLIPAILYITALKSERELMKEKKPIKKRKAKKTGKK
jgi:uncharacterized protein YaaW (UPF0174 family)